MAALGPDHVTELGHAFAAFIQQRSAPSGVEGAPASAPVPAGGLASAQAQNMARLFTSGGAPAAALAAVTNGNVEQRLPGATSSAKDILAGGSSSFSPEAVATTALPGGIPFSGGMDISCI